MGPYRCPRGLGGGGLCRCLRGWAGLCHCPPGLGSATARGGWALPLPAGAGLCRCPRERGWALPLHAGARLCRCPPGAGLCHGPRGLGFAAARGNGAGLCHCTQGRGSVAARRGLGSAAARGGGALPLPAAGLGFPAARRGGQGRGGPVRPPDRRRLDGVAGTPPTVARAGGESGLAGRRPGQYGTLWLRARPAQAGRPGARAGPRRPGRREPGSGTGASPGRRGLNLVWRPRSGRTTRARRTPGVEGHTNRLRRAPARVAPTGRDAPPGSGAHRPGPRPQWRASPAEVTPTGRGGPRGRGRTTGPQPRWRDGPAEVTPTRRDGPLGSGTHHRASPQVAGRPGAGCTHQTGRTPEGGGAPPEPHPRWQADPAEVTPTRRDGPPRAGAHHRSPTPSDGTARRGLHRRDGPRRRGPLPGPTPGGGTARRGLHRRDGPRGRGHTSRAPVAGCRAGVASVPPGARRIGEGVGQGVRTWRARERSASWSSSLRRSDGWMSGSARQARPAWRLASSTA